MIVFIANDYTCIIQQPFFLKHFLTLLSNENNVPLFTLGIKTWGTDCCLGLLSWCLRNCQESSPMGWHRGVWMEMEQPLLLN